MSSAAEKINDHELEKDSNDALSILEAVSETQAVIEFNPDGTIINANYNFCKAMGYSLGEFKNKHHSIFCKPDYIKSLEYRNFWLSLSRGEFQGGEFDRLTKDGKVIWLNATYTPIKDVNGKVYKVVKFANDITLQKETALENEDNIARINSMVENMPTSVMYADLDGKILYMNPATENTLKKVEKDLPVAVEKMIGANIEIFHESFSHQKKIFADERNLPLISKIKFGKETLQLYASPIKDAEGEYIGPMVTWDLITDKRELLDALTQTSEQLIVASEQLTATASKMQSNSETTSAESNTAAAGAEEVARGIQVVATNTEEMTASIKEISRSSQNSAIMSNETLEKSHSTIAVINQLGISSKEIGNVVKVISTIAQQTNLLALNATIEAARAGDAGKGFAVVANEVKELAKQTANATEDIANKIGAIQSDTQGAVGAIGEITVAVEELNGIASSIASAIEEQLATTNEVARVVQESTVGVSAIAGTIGSVNQAANSNAAGSTQTLEAAKGLHSLANELKELVSRIEI